MIHWTFRRQVVLVWVFGLSIMALGIGQIYAAIEGASSVVAGGAIMILAAGVARPIMRRAFLKNEGTAARHRLTAGAAGAFWRDWLAVDRAGIPND